MKPQSEILKGCDSLIETYAGVIRCGSNILTSFTGKVKLKDNKYCKTCQSLLNQTNEIIKMIDEDIRIQEEFLLKEPQNKKSIEWRIIGMTLLKQEIIGE